MTVVELGSKRLTHTTAFLVSPWNVQVCRKSFPVSTVKCWRLCSIIWPAIPRPRSLVWQCREYSCTTNYTSKLLWKLNISSTIRRQCVI